MEGELVHARSRPSAPIGRALRLQPRLPRAGERHARRPPPWWSSRPGVTEADLRDAVRDWLDRGGWIELLEQTAVDRRSPPATTARHRRVRHIDSMVDAVIDEHLDMILEVCCRRIPEGTVVDPARPARRRPLSTPSPPDLGAASSASTSPPQRGTMQPMVLSIKSTDADRLARELCSVTGESITDAVTTALRERLDRVQADRNQVAHRLLAIGAAGTVTCLGWTTGPTTRSSATTATDCRHDAGRRHIGDHGDPARRAGERASRPAARRQ